MCHATEQQTIQAGTPCIIVCIHGITRYLSPLLHGQRVLDTCGTARLTCWTFHTSWSPAHEVSQSCASEGKPDDLMLYSGILLQHKERHTELHVSKAIIPWLYFPVSGVHHQPIDLPKRVYPNWPMCTPRKHLRRTYHLFLFILAQILLYSCCKFFTTKEFRDASLYKHQCLFFHKLQGQPSACNSFVSPATFSSLFKKSTSIITLQTKGCSWWAL